MLGCPVVCTGRYESTGLKSGKGLNTADVGGHLTHHEQLGQHLNHLVRLPLSAYLQRQRVPRVRIDRGQPLQWPAVPGAGRG